MEIRCRRLKAIIESVRICRLLFGTYYLKLARNVTDLNRMHARETSVSVYTLGLSGRKRSINPRSAGGRTSVGGCVYREQQYIDSYRTDGGISGFMGAVVIYAIAKNARGNGGKRAPKTKTGRIGNVRVGFLREVEIGRERKDVPRTRVSVRFRG